jgi:lipopolysaccharide export system protein LptA
MIRIMQFTAMLLCAGLSFDAVAEKADRNKPMEITAARLNAADGGNEARLEGSIVIEQGTLRVTADKGEIRQNATGQKSGFVTGAPVYMRQKREGCDAYIEARAERVEFDEAKDSLRLLNKASIRTGENEITGDAILYNTVTEAIEVLGDKPRTANDGRVRLILHPRDSGKDPCPKKTDKPAQR